MAFTSSRLPFIIATAVFAWSGVAVNACSLNPQPLPPDQPGDSGRVVNNPPPGVDSGMGKGGGADATTAVDSGGMFAADSASPVPESDAGPDSGLSADTSAGDGEVDGAVDGEVDGRADGPTGDAPMTADGPSDGAEDGG